MKSRMRYLSSILAMAMVISNMPMTALAAPAADQENRQETKREAVEVKGVSRLDDMDLSNKEGRVEPLYQADDVVTVIVEMQDAPVMDYYTTATYAAETEEDADMTPGEAVSKFLASEDAKEFSEELKEGQNDVLAGIAQLTGAGSAMLTAEEEDGAPEEAETFEVLDQWTIIANAAAVRVPYHTLAEIKKLDGVKRAYVQHVYDHPDPVENGDLMTGLDTREGVSYNMANINGAWKEGFTGKGMLVAVLDSGLDIKLNEKGQVIRTHEAFSDDSFYSGNPTDGVNDWELRYTNDSLKQFLEENQLISTTGSDGEKIVYDNNALYKNVKVPYACDYADGDLHVMPAESDHGTHVSGTVAGYAETEEGGVKFSGVAPDAQIIFMKVFPDAGGGAMEYTLINALEDTLRLGADLVNLSLGSDNGYAEDDTIQHDAYQRVEAAGIAMMTSAGNSDYSSSGNNYSGENLSEDPDTSVMSSPAVYDSNLSVASIENGINVRSFFTWTDDQGVEHRVGYSDPYTVAMKSSFADKEYPIYPVGGVGTAEDYGAAGFNNGWNGGKTGLALVKRGEISFADKVNNAMSYTGVNSRGERYGVAAVIVYDSDPNGTELINMNVDNTSLTSAFISGKDGAAIVEAVESGYEVKIQVSLEDETIENPTAGQMSSFTSWGAGPGLELKPEITAPGGNIWSTVVDRINQGNDNYVGSYGMMSGTSMAAPHMTGIAALVRQYITTDEKFAGVQKVEESDLISRLLVSTAVPQKDTDGVYYSPRQQGAGLVNAEAAVKTPAYITVDGKHVGKLEFLDDPEKKGSYDISFHVTNVSDQEVTYDVTAALLRPDTGEVDSPWGARDAILPKDVLLSENAIGTITVPAKATADFSATVALTEDQKKELDALFKNGTYVEGFVTLTDTKGENPQLGLPMLAFYGDWTAAPIFDRSLWIDAPEDGESVLNNEATWRTSVVGSQIIAGGEVLGYIDGAQNLFATGSGEEQTTYCKENITISPNGDGYLDMFDDYVIYQLRNARLIVVEVTDQQTGEVYFRDWASYAFKTTYAADYGFAFPFSLYGTIPVWQGTDQDGNLLPSGTKCMYTITAYGDGDYGDPVYSEEAGSEVTDFDSVIPGEHEPTFNGHPMNMEGDVISFPVTVDINAPKLENNSVSIIERDGRTILSGKIYDPDGAIASVEILPYVTRSYVNGEGGEVGLDKLNPFYRKNIFDPETKTLEFEADITEYSHKNMSFPGEDSVYKYEWTGNMLISCGDYGLNDRSYVVTADATPGIVLSRTAALLHPGNEFDLSVNYNTEDTTAELTRTSSNPEVATVDEFGNVKAIAPGQAIITVSDGKDSAICVVAVDPINTEVKDFNLSIDHFSGLKTDGELVVKVTDLEPADVKLSEIRWEFFEDEDYTEYASGLLSVQKESADALSGAIYMNLNASQELLPAGKGELRVTLNGVTRVAEVGWDEVYTSILDDGLMSGSDFGGQCIYVKQGETAELSAKYRQADMHATGDVLAELTGLQLDGPNFFAVGGGVTHPYQAKLVNEEGYALPESIEVYTVYDYGTESEYRYRMEAGGYYGYHYDPATGELDVPAPYGAENKILIVAAGTESAGNPAGTLSGETYEKPDGLWGPFDWEVTDGTGKLEMGTGGSSWEGEYEVANYTPAEPGVSYVTARTKDGQYAINFAVVSEPVKADTLTLSTRRMDLTAGKKKTLKAELTPAPTLEKDQKVIYKSYAPEVAAVDENGVVTAVQEGYAYIKAYTAADNRVLSNCVVHVTAPNMVDTELARVIALIEGMENTKIYTADSWRALTEALAEAKAVAENGDATQAENDAALKKLMKAFVSLVEVQTVHLETAIEEAQKLLVLAANYEDTAALEAAVEAGQAALEKANPSQEEIDRAAYAILDEITRLAKSVDVKSLENLIEAAKALLEEEYTSESLDVLRKAIEDAEMELGNPDRDENAIGKAYASLIDAIMKLQRQGNKAALQAMILKANSILEHSERYVASTLEGLDEVLADAQEVYDNKDVSQEVIDESVRTLTMKTAAVRLLGDVNADGRITTSDSALLLQYAAEMVTLDQESLESADVNKDGTANTSDAAKILQYGAEKIVSF